MSINDQRHQGVNVGIGLTPYTGNNRNMTAVATTTLCQVDATRLSSQLTAFGERQFQSRTQSAAVASCSASVSGSSSYYNSLIQQFSPSSVSSTGTPGAISTSPSPTVARQNHNRKSAFVAGDEAIRQPGSATDDFATWYPVGSSKRRRGCTITDADTDDSSSFVSGSSGQVAAMMSSPVGVETPPISPIDMVEQERIKLERKRARNRLAATRCRNRKLERIATLQDQADRLRATNARLANEVNRLRDTVYQLRRDVTRHTMAGCQAICGGDVVASAPTVFPVFQPHQTTTYAF